MRADRRQPWMIMRLIDWLTGWLIDWSKMFLTRWRHMTYFFDMSYRLWAPLFPLFSPKKISQIRSYSSGWKLELHWFDLPRTRWHTDAALWRIPTGKYRRWRRRAPSIAGHCCGWRMSRKNSIPTLINSWKSFAKHVTPTLSSIFDWKIVFQENFGWFFRQVQSQVRLKKERFDSQKLDTLQKIDLLAISRLNMLSQSLSPYGSTLVDFYQKVATVFGSVVVPVNRNADEAEQRILKASPDSFMIWYKKNDKNKSFKFTVDISGAFKGGWGPRGRAPPSPPRQIERGREKTNKTMKTRIINQPISQSISGPNK